MSILDFELDTTKNLPNKPLEDVEKELISATASFNASPPALAGITFKLSAQANGKIEAYNEPSDKDEDGVLGKKVEEETPAGKITIPPQIELSDQAAWLKYRFLGSAGVSAEAKVAPVAFKIDASKKIVFADYHAHGRGENTIAAAAADIPNLRFVGNADDAFELGANEALYYQVRGEFSASVTLSWSDVFTAGLTQISSSMLVNELLMFEIAPSLSVKFHVGVVDDFQLVLTKGSGSKVRVALKKGKSDELGVSAGFQVAVKFADEEKAEEILNQIYEATLGQPISKLNQILSKASFDELTPAQKKIVEFIIKRLNLSDEVQSLEDFKKKIADYEKKIKDTISTVAKSKVELGFKYEYLRVRTDDTLLVVQLDEATFRQYHKDLMLCDYIDLLDWARNNPNAVEQFLKQNTLTITEAWGFTLGIGKWKSFGIDEKEFKSVVQEDLQRRKRIAYTGIRGYKGSFFGKFDWTVDFKAEMNNFAANPTTCDFEYGLHFRRSYEEKMSRDELREFFDDALIWQVLTITNLKQALDAIEAQGYTGKKAKLGVEFTIKDSTLKKLLPKIASADNSRLGAEAMAMAMPYLKRYQTRADILNDRQRAYAPLWKAYLNQPDANISGYAVTAWKEIKNLSILQDEADLSDYEKGFSNPAGQPVYTQHPQSFSGQIYYLGSEAGDYSGIANKWKKFTGGLTTLSNVIKPGNCAPHETLKNVFKEIRPFFSQAFFVRASGVYLIRLAAENGLLGEINRSCTVAYSDKTFTFGKAG